MAICDRFPQIYCVDASEQNRLIDKLNELDVVYFVIDGSNISGADSFYTEAASILPLDPPLTGTKRNWDAFVDSLWEGLANLEQSKVAIIWTNADQIANAALSQLIEICIVMNDVIKSVSQESTGISIPVNLALILMGNGESFGSADQIL